MIQVHSPQNEIDLAIIESLLESEGIAYHVRNDHFGTIRAGIQIPGLNDKGIMVDEADAETARALIADYLEKTAEPADAEPPPRGAFDRIRAVLEIVVGGWHVPSYRARRRQTPPTE